MWALFWGTSTITTTPMRWRSQAGLRRRRRHQRRRGEGRNDVGTTRHPILEAANHAPRSSSPLMPRKPRRHRRRRRRDRGRRQRKLTYGMEEDAARREDDDEDDEGRSEDSGGPICRPEQKTGGAVGRPCVRCRATATTAAAGGERPGRRHRSCRHRPTTDRRLGEIGGANLHRRRRREQRGRRRGGRGGGRSYTVM